MNYTRDNDFHVTVIGRTGSGMGRLFGGNDLNTFYWHLNGEKSFMQQLRLRLRGER